MASFAQLLDCGLSSAAIAHRVRSGRLHRIHRGVYAVGHDGLTQRGVQFAALLASGPGAVLSHGSAALVWGILDVRVSPVTVTVPRDARRRPRTGVRVHATSSLERADRRLRDGLALTAPGRTIVDLAPLLGGGLIDTFERARVRGLVTADDVALALQRSSALIGRRAVRALLAAVAGNAPFTRSEAERRALALIRRSGLPAARVNARVAGHEVDLLWPGRRLVVEIDGYAYHGSRAAFERDRRRDGDLLAAGYRVLRVSWRQLADEPETLVARRRTLLG